MSVFGPTNPLPDLRALSMGLFPHLAPKQRSFFVKVMTKLLQKIANLNLNGVSYVLSTSVRFCVYLGIKVTFSSSQIQV